MNQLELDMLKSQIEQFRMTEKISRETPPYYPQRKNRYLRLMEFNNYKQSFQNKSYYKQTFVTANKHSSKIDDLSKLKPIFIKSMMVNKIHYGHYLICRVIEDPYQVAAISLIVEDENGDIEDLSIYNYTEKEDHIELFSKGTVIYIKEPFLKLPKEGMGSFIRIDSPSDIIIDDYNYSGKFCNEIKQLQKSKNPEILKKNGNDYYSKEKYDLALRCYKLALNFNPIQPFLLYLNCSAAYIGLEMHSQAYIEASKSIDIIQKQKLEKSNEKSLEKARFRMAKAAYGMRQWKNALENLNQCLLINPDNPESLSFLKRTELRMKENASGEFDFLQIYNKFQSDKIYDLDIADYHHPDLLIQENSLKGKHVVAKADIPKGTLLVVSKAFSFGRYVENKIPVISMNMVTNMMDTPSDWENLIKLFKKIQSNPFLAKEVYSLHSQNMFDRNEVIPDHIVDVSRLECISSVNAFEGEDFSTLHLSGKKINESFENSNTMNRDRQLNSSSGLWIYPSLFNHSCIANTSRNFIGDVLIMSSCRDIQKGEEVTNTYVFCLSPYDERKKHLSKYGFKCCCELCELDKNDTKRKSREALFINLPTSSQDIQNLLYSMEKTFENKEKLKFILLKPLAVWQNYLFDCGKFEECARSHIQSYEIIKDFIPDMACLIALKIRYCFEKANKFSEAEIWIQNAKENDVFHNFDLLKNRFKNFIKF